MFLLGTAAGLLGCPRAGTQQPTAGPPPPAPAGIKLDLPDVPTLIESGFPGMEVYGWIGIFAPAGTPEAVVARLNRDFIATIQDADVAKRLVSAGVEPVGSTPAELDRWVRSEYEKWSKFVKSSNLSFKE